MSVFFTHQVFLRVAKCEEISLRTDCRVNHWADHLCGRARGEELAIVLRVIASQQPCAQRRGRVRHRNGGHAIIAYCLMPVLALICLHAPGLTWTITTPEQMSHSLAE